jgi:hypothetical protein
MAGGVGDGGEIRVVEGIKLFFLVVMEILDKSSNPRPLRKFVLPIRCRDSWLPPCPVLPPYPLMPAPQVHQLHVGPITAFSFNGDGSKVAISPNSSDVEIYATKGSGFTKTETLTDVLIIILSIILICSTIN